MRLNLNYLTKESAEQKIIKALKGKIDIFQYYEILSWSKKNEDIEDFYETCHYAEEQLEVKKEDILAMPLNDFAFIYKERHGYFSFYKYLDFIDDIDMLFKLYEKLGGRIAFDLLDYLKENFITQDERRKIANSKLGYNLIFRASILPTKEMRDKNIPFVTALTNVMEDQAKKIQLLNQFNEELFFEACETAKEEDFAKAVEMISEKRQAKILSENNLVKLKEVNPKFYDVYCDKLVKAF